jgi:hypothetical protein
MTRRQKYTEPVSVQEDSLPVKEANVIEPATQYADGKGQTAPLKKKRIRHRQTVKLHNKKLSVAVICANPYLRQFL